MAFPGIPQFQAGERLQDGDRLNDFVHNTLSVDPNVKAHAGGGQQFATLIDAVVDVITRVTTTGDSVQLPPTEGRRGFGPSLAGLQLLIINSASNACQVFGNFFENSTIGGTAGSTGISLGGGSSLSLVCGGPGVWISIAGGAGGGLPVTGGTLSGGLGLTTAQGIVGTGSNSQSTAALITTQEAIVTSFATSGSGVRLPLFADITGSLGPILIKNKDLVNSGQVWPPVGGVIDSNATNISVTIPAGTDLYIVPGTTTNQWWS